MIFQIAPRRTIESGSGCCLRRFYPREGQPRRVDSSEAEKRLGEWLRAAKLDRRSCGRWLFTWNAFKIECDPDAVIASVGEYQLRFLDAREGAPLTDPMAGKAVPLRLEGKALTATFSLDPSKLRLQRAETDVVVAEVSGKPMTLEEALARRAEEQASGAITIKLEVDAKGDVQRRTRRMSFVSKDGDGKTVTEEREEVTEALDRVDSRSTGLGPDRPSL